MMPGGDQTPSGGILENPEAGIKLEVNTLMLRLTYEKGHITVHACQR